MPEMDGFQFVMESRKVEAWQSIPIVVMTSKDLTQQDRDMLNGNVEKILQKSAYSQKEFLQVVREQIQTATRSA